ncbi:hypothetical protein AAFN85_16295 [Mucilaginibacter sp. CAU 1740]|uniref:hypothetical protein n=1 Tax=Mucilaginibacter sp. CAU 1740 TaxID=3140365 RepID=UPI00325AA591
MDVIELTKIIDNYYPPGIALNDDRLKANDRYRRLIEKCLLADSEREQWQRLITSIKQQVDAEISEFILLKEHNSRSWPLFLPAHMTIQRVTINPAN